MALDRKSYLIVIGNLPKFVLFHFVYYNTGRERKKERVYS